MAGDPPSAASSSGTPVNKPKPTASVQPAARGDVDSAESAPKKVRSLLLPPFPGRCMHADMCEAVGLCSAIDVFEVALCNA